MAKESPKKELDDFNKSIIDALQKNARVSLVEIGKTVGLSAPAVAERIRKMEEAGLITAYSTLVNYEKLGIGLQVFIHYKATKISHEAMTRMLNEMSEVTEWYFVTGSYCAILKVVVQSTIELDATIEKLQRSGETNTSVILSTHIKPRLLAH